MGLRAKFNLAIIAALLVGYVAAGFALHRLFVANARAAVLENARVMMAAANAVQGYTDKQIVPITGLEQNGKFFAASVPFFAAKETFRGMQAAFPDYALAELALNPTNREDRPADWQADFIHDFRNHPALKELTGVRATPTGESLDLAQPIAVDDPSCLACHSTPAVAPASMVRAYGPDNGFGWKLHETVGAQIVSVPMALALAKANTAFMTVMAILALTSLVVLVILNVLLHVTVIRPVVKVAAIADAVSLGKPGVEEWQKPGHDEIAVLSAAFNRMRRSLDTALRLIETP
jgi:HAMP domain-containing protein